MTTALPSPRPPLPAPAGMVVNRPTGDARMTVSAKCGAV